MQNLNFLLLCFITLTICCIKAQTPCRTPNSEQARCIPIRSCQVLYDAVLSDDPEVIRFLRASQCGYNGQPLVCCGSQASYAPPPTKRPLIRRPDLLPRLNDCGAVVDSKIYNGNDTELDEYPWTALIRYRTSDGREEFSCGASLISNRYILTAAHCVKGPILTLVGTPVSVRLGEWNTETEVDCVTSPLGKRTCVPDKPVDVNIEEIIAHDGYIDRSNEKANDIALIRLDRSIAYTGFIKPICLPQTNEEVRAGDVLVVAGWGRTEKGQYSAIKQKLGVPVVDSSKCAATYMSRFANFNVKESQLCAGGVRDQDSCQGDSGGPLMVEKSSQMFLAGVVSFGYECGKEGWPGIYTRINKYRDWIEGNLRD